MVCKNCGAEIKKSYPKCRKCGTVNPKFGNKKNSDNKIILIIGIALIALSIIILIFFKINDFKVNEQHDKHISTLEQNLKNKDYELLCQYIDSNSISGTEFDKYLQVYSIYKYKRLAENSVNKLDSCTSDSNPTDVNYTIQTAVSNCLYGITQCNIYINDNIKLNNEECLTGFIQDFKNILRSDLKLDEADIDTLCKLSDITEASLTPYISDIYGKLYD